MLSESNFNFRKVNLDISKAKYGPEGVEGLFWPYERTSMLPVRRILFDGFMQAIRKNYAEGDKIALAARLFSKWFLMECIKLYDAVSIHREFQKSEVTPIVPERFKILSALEAGQTPQSDLFLLLSKWPDKSDPLYLAKKTIRELEWNWRPLKVFRAFDEERDILTCEPTTQTIAHARRERRYLRYCSLRKWFSKMPQGILQKPAGVKKSPAFNLLMDLVEKSFEAGGQQLPEWISEYFIQWFSYAVNFATFHLENIYKRASELPNNFWSGTVMSTVWLRMLTYAIREKGGKVVVHEHGTDNSHFDQSWIHFVAYAGCDEFYAPNRKSMEVKRKELKPEYFFSKKPPDISCPEETDEGSLNTPNNYRIIKIEKRLSKILYVPTAFHGESGRLRPYLSDLVYLDWQARLFGILQSMKIEVVHQPHPEGQSRPSEGFAEFYGFKTHRGRFEDFKEEVDAYLLDYIASSTTAPILKSDKPVIFFDVGYPKLLADAKDLLKGRCYYIPTWTDSQNRLETEWNKLKDILKSKDHRFSTSFPDIYLAGH